MAKTLLVGLGNPGFRYQKNRHNIGAYFLIWLQKEWLTSPWEKSKNLALLSFSPDNSLILARPLVYMNESGKTVSQLKRFYKIPLQKIIIIHDDTDLPFYSFKFNFARGSAGHKGVESIINYLKSKKFFRLRIGVRPREAPREKAGDLVLKNFSPEEEKRLKEEFPLLKKFLEEQIPQLDSLAKRRKI